MNQLNPQLPLVEVVLFMVREASREGLSMRIFISAGEPSGDLHGSNFARALHTACPAAQIVGFGGPRLVEAKQQQLYPLADHAVMGLWRVLIALPHFYRYFQMAKEQFDHLRPDAVVLIDYPGFHWHLAKAAHQRGIPVYWFVPPQIWAWATHRVKRMRKWVDHVFCNLPFETKWYQDRGVTSSFIGHPYFDALGAQQLDATLVDQQRSRPERIVALLPGSRTHEVHDNLPMMLKSARLIHDAVPDTRFLVAGFKRKQVDWIRQQLQQHSDLPIEVHLGRTPEIIHLAQVCLAVSGSVSLELLNATLPTVTLYKLGPMLLPMVKLFKHARWISLINLLAEQEISPEYLTARDDSAAIANHMTGWLQDENARQQVMAKMQTVKQQVALPGACQRAVEYMLSQLNSRKALAA